MDKNGKKNTNYTCKFINKKINHIIRKKIKVKIMRNINENKFFL